MEKVYKGIGGYVPEKDGHPATHILLKIEEFNNLVNTRNSYKEKYEDEQKAHENTKSKYKKWADDEIAKAKEQFEESTRKWTNSLMYSNDKRLKAEELNNNLIRICKERANAERGLSPKKKHSGYIALKSEQAKRVQYNGKKREESPVWKTTIQTPYKIQLTEEQARELIGVEIQGNRIFDFSGSYYTDWKMIKDMKTGFWNIALETEGEFRGFR